MMKRYNALVVFILFIIVCSSCDRQASLEDEKDNEVSTVDTAVLLDEEYNALLYVLNYDQVQFRDTLQYVQIDSVSPDSITAKQEKSYGCIIILNRKGNGDLSHEELRFLKSFSDEERYDVVYIGTKDLGKFVEAGFIPEVSENERGMTYAPASVDRGDICSIVGCWTTVEEEYCSQDEGFYERTLLGNVELLARMASRWRQNANTNK